MNARYQSGTNGQFIAEDPVFLGDPNRQNLGNPQSLNSYSYAEGNPVGKSDPSGFASKLTPQQWSYFQGQINAIQAQIDALRYVSKTSVTINTTKQAVTAFIDPFAGYRSATNPALSTPERAGAGVGMAVGGASIVKDVAFTGAKAIWTATKELSPAKNALKHFYNHGDDFGAENAVDYVKKAREFLFNPPEGTQTIIRTNGEKVLYNAEINTMGIMTSQSTPVTFFKPNPAIHGRSTNLEYFYDQQW